MPKDYPKSEDKPRRRERSRSRSRSRTNSRDRKDLGRDRRERKKTSKWSDAPVESKFSSGPINPSSSGFSNQPHLEKESLNQFDSKNTHTNFNSLNNLNSSLMPPMQMASKSKNNNLNFLDDNTKLKRKIYIPKSSEINYVGLLIGPKGTYQKRLEQQTGCKILIRGKGTQKEGNPPQPDDHEEKHVLIIGDSEDKLIRAQNLIEKVLFADEKTRGRIKEEQIKASQEIRSELLMTGGEIPQIEEYMLTPYGPPDKNARIVPVPNDCVGLIIGKNGETIRRLNRESGCKVQIAIKAIPNTEVRNVFIEGPPEKYEIAKKLIEEIVSEQISLKERNPFFQLNLMNNQQINTDPAVGQVNPFPGPHTPLRIPNKMVGLIIGRSGETVKTIHEKTKCFIFIPKESRPGEDFRELQLSGPPGSVELCKREIISMIHLALYGRLPYMNSLYYPFLDPVTGLPIIDPNTLSQLDPNTRPEGGVPREMTEEEQEQINMQMNQLTQMNQMPNIPPMGNLPPMHMMPNPQMQGNVPFNEPQNFYNKPQFGSHTHPGHQKISQPFHQPPKMGYDLNDYDNPMNYDLYFQSLYQMYPHMNDYTKSGPSHGGHGGHGMGNMGNMGMSAPQLQHQPQFVAPNQGMMDENRAMYDPNYVVNMFNQMMEANPGMINQVNQGNFNNLNPNANFEEHMLLMRGKQQEDNNPEQNNNYPNDQDFQNQQNLNYGNYDIRNEHQNNEQFNNEENNQYNCQDKN